MTNLSVAILLSLNFSHLRRMLIEFQLFNVKMTVQMVGVCVPKTSRSTIVHRVKPRMHFVFHDRRWS